jgi:hypothetical protein
MHQTESRESETVRGLRPLILDNRHHRFSFPCARIDIQQPEQYAVCFCLDSAACCVQTETPMEQPIRKPTRTEELRDLLEKWEERLYPVFLQLGLDVREFWQRWDT